MIKQGAKDLLILVFSFFRELLDHC